MTIDLSEFHGVFFEECYEGLDTMESGLLALDKSADIEEINTIFRAAHSIKGGAGSFGFTDIANFTHLMETLLDEMRDGRRDITKYCVDLLLESVDLIRSLVTDVKDNLESDRDRINEVQSKLEELLSGENSGSGDKESESDQLNAEESNTGSSGWSIRFVPPAEILKSGNEPIRIFRELSSMGDMKIVSDTASLPDLQYIDPECCYLSWNIELKGEIEKADIEELFSWVADESKLFIEPLGGSADLESDQSSTEEKISGPAEQNEIGEVAESNIEEKSSSSSEPGGAKPAAKEKSGGDSGGSIRVATNKVDELINMAGELIITQSMLSQISTQYEDGGQVMMQKLRDGIMQLERNTRELQESILQIRMLPISFSFSRFPRLIRDLSRNMGKKIELKMTGENTEVDKTVIEKIGDPLVHLIRNSLDHGLEMPDVRKAAGKSETGTLELQAYHEGSDIVINVIDDGAGLNRERILNKAIEKGLISEGETIPDDRLFNLIFAPGFSTAEKISDVSGRGVGMDVVRRNVRDLGGNVTIASNEGAGSTVTIRLPLTLSILDGQLVRIGNETYIVSLVFIVESLQMNPECISRVNGEAEFYHLRNEYIPIIRLGSVFGRVGVEGESEEGLLMVVEADGNRFGLFVDSLLGQQQVVIKSLEKNFRKIQGISGSTILGDGTVALIIDVPGLIQLYDNNGNHLGGKSSEVA